MHNYIIVGQIEENNLKLKSVIVKTGCQVQISETKSGTEVFSMLKAQRPDIIFLSPELTDGSGLEICKKIKSGEAFHSIPVVLFIENQGEGHTSDDLIRSGADDLVVFPLDELSLPFRIKKLAGNNQSNTATSETEENRLYRNLCERMPDGIYRSTPEGRLLKVNPALAKMLGYGSMEELLAANTQSDLYFHPSERERLALPGNPEGIGVFRLRKKDGTEIWVEDHGWHTLDENGDILFYEGILRDITDRRISEQILRDSEERFKTLFEQAPVGFQSIDGQGCLLEVNETWLEMMGYQRDEVLGHWFGDFLTSQSAEFFQSMCSTFRHGKTLHAEFEMIKKDGSVMNINLQGRISHTTVGTIRQTHCVISDITREKQTERRMHQLLKGIEQSHANIVVTNPQGIIEYVNSKFTEITGYSFDEVKGKNPSILKSGKTPLKEYQKLWDTITSGNEYRGELLNRKRNGDLYWESVLISPIRNEGGDIINYMAIKEDITARKKTDLEIHKLSVAIDQNPASVIITNTEGVIEYVNKKFLTVSGYENDELIGKVIRILKPGHTPDDTYIEIWNNLLAGREWRGEHQNRTKKREFYWESVLISPIKSNDGKITNYIILSEDISDRKKMEKELIMAKEKAEESDRLKSAFLANMSHEIRTPLNSILGFSDLLTEPSLDERSRREYASLITSSGSNLLAIINDVLDISKIEAGQISLSMTQFSAQELVQTIRNEYAYKALSKNLEIRINIQSEANNIHLESDEMRIRQMLVNFVANALKFTENGFIEIGFSHTGNEVRFHVKDTGIGISEEYHDKIFDRFRQVEAANTRRYGGNGLGLTITKNLAELLGGKIWLESEPGQGSTFYLSLPGSCVVINQSSI